MSRSSSTLVSVLAVLAASTLASCSKPAETPAPAPAAPAPAPVAEAPPPAPKEATHKSFMIGELTGIALRDGALEFPNDNKIFGLGKTPEEVGALLSAAGQPTDKFHLGLDPLLVQAPDHVLLFDTGAGTNFGPGAGKLLASLGEAGVDPASVTDIFISHVHGDHVGGLVNAAGALNFPNATIHISKPEWAFLTGVKADKAKEFGVQNYDALIAAMKPKVDAFAPNAELVKGVVKAVAIKGHTPGHSAYKISSGGESLLYIGDAMHSSIVSVQKPEWPMAFDSDRKTAAASRAALLADAEKNGQRIYAVHFPFPGLGRIQKQGDGYVWVAE
jgi:glyoxylase-like metal-dependent hydrolase (beta-lactamase superfamily II)